MTSKDQTLERPRSTRALARAMLAVGALLLLIGAGWTLANSRAEFGAVEETEAGAVVLAATASPTPTDLPSPTPTSTRSLSRVGARATPVRADREALVPTARPTLSPSPTPTPADPPTRIVAPSIKLDAEVTRMGWRTINYKGKSWNEWVVPKDTAGWLIGSAAPGQVGNTVLSAHHNIHAKVFRYVIDLEIGDKITLHAGDREYTYSVTEKYILKEAGMPASVRHKNAQWIAPTDDNRLTLVTCWPYQWPGNTHRVIVVAKPVVP